MQYKKIHNRHFYWPTLKCDVTQENAFDLLRIDMMVSSLLAVSFRGSLHIPFVSKMHMRQHTNRAAPSYSSHPSQSLQCPPATLVHKALSTNNNQSRQTHRFARLTTCRLSHKTNPTLPSPATEQPFIRDLPIPKPLTSLPFRLRGPASDPYSHR